MKLFADDIKMYVKVSAYDDIIKRRAALGALTVWARTCHLSISVEKRCVPNIGYAGLTEIFCIDDLMLPVLSQCRDL
jgi:hypothetical protein